MVQVNRHKPVSAISTLGHNFVSVIPGETPLFLLTFPILHVIQMFQIVLY
jgi:hypothetical protein